MLHYRLESSECRFLKKIRQQLHFFYPLNWLFSITQFKPVMKKAILLIITFSAILPFSYSQDIKLSIPQAKGDSELHVGDWFNESFETYINVDYPAINDPDSTKKAFLVTMTTIPVYNEARDFNATVTINEPGSKAPFYVKKGESGTFRAKIKLTNLKKPGKYQCLIETTINDQKSTTLVTIDKKNSPKKAKSFILKESKPIYITGDKAKIIVYVEDTMNVETKFNPIEITDFNRHFGDKEEAFTTAEYASDYLEKPFKVISNDIKDVDITIDNLKKAGKYTGKIQVNAEDKFSETFDFTIYRRHGWWWALILIISGIILNYFILWLRGNFKSFSEQKLEISYLRERLLRINKNLTDVQREKRKNLIGYFEEEIAIISSKNWKTLYNPEWPKSFKINYDIITVKLNHLPLWLENAELYDNYASKLPSYEKDLQEIVNTHESFLRKEFSTKEGIDGELKTLPAFGTLLATIEQEETKRKNVQDKLDELENEIKTNQKEWQSFSDVLHDIQKNNLNSFFSNTESVDLPSIREAIANKEWDKAKKEILATEVRMKKILVEMLNGYLTKLTDNVNTHNQRYNKVIEQIKNLPEGEEFNENKKISIDNYLKSEDFEFAHGQVKSTKEKGAQFITLASAEAPVEETIDRRFIEFISFFKNIPQNFDKNVRNIDRLLHLAEKDLKITQKPLYKESLKDKSRNISPTSGMFEINKVISRNLSIAQTRSLKAQQVREDQIKITKTAFEKIPSSKTVITQLFWQNIGYHAIIILISCLAGVYVLWVDKMMWGSFSDILTAFLWGLGIQAASTQSTPATIKKNIAALKPPAS